MASPLPWRRIGRAAREGLLAAGIAVWVALHAWGGPLEPPAHAVQVVLAIALLPSLLAPRVGRRGRLAGRAGLLVLAAWATAAGLALAARALSPGALEQGADRVARDLLLTALGLGHLARFFAAALPDALAALRRPLAWLGAVLLGLLAADGAGGARAAGWLPGWFVAALFAPLVAGWVLAQWAGRERGVRWTRGAWLGAVRFACPRCGVQQDFARPVSPCNECGLLVRVDWGGERRSAEAEDRALDMRKAVGYACPCCTAPGLWSQGESACERCGIRVRLAWNAGGAHAPAEAS